MIAKKMLMWVAAGTLSAASIPAIGATISHHVRKHAAKPVTVIHHFAAKPAVKAATKHVKPTVLTAHHVKTLKLKTAKTTAVHAKATASHGTVGVLAMHSGHTTLVKPVSHKTVAPAKTTHLLAAKVKTQH